MSQSLATPRRGSNRKAATLTRSRRDEPPSAINPPNVFSRGCIVLTTTFEFDYTPENPLAIPRGWARNHDGDFRCTGDDFCTRSMALGRAASENRAAMKELDRRFRSDPDNSVHLPWALVFEIGEIEEGSFISVEGGCKADVNLETSVHLVRPTAEEIEHNIAAGKRGAA